MKIKIIILTLILYCTILHSARTDTELICKYSVGNDSNWSSEWRNYTITDIEFFLNGSNYIQTILFDESDSIYKNYKMYDFTDLNNKISIIYNPNTNNFENHRLSTYEEFDTFLYVGFWFLDPVSIGNPNGDTIYFFNDWAGAPSGPVGDSVIAFTPNNIDTKITVIENSNLEFYKGGGISMNGDTVYFFGGFGGSNMVYTYNTLTNKTDTTSYSNIPKIMECYAAYNDTYTFLIENNFSGFLSKDTLWVIYRYEFKNDIWDTFVVDFSQSKGVDGNYDTTFIPGSLHYYQDNTDSKEYLILCDNVDTTSLIGEIGIGVSFKIELTNNEPDTIDYFLEKEIISPNDNYWGRRYSIVAGDYLYSQGGFIPTMPSDKNDTCNIIDVNSGINPLEAIKTIYTYNRSGKYLNRLNTNLFFGNNGYIYKLDIRYRYP